MNSLDVLLSAIAADPADDTAWLALADCLEEQGQPDRAELVRQREWLRYAPIDHPERRQRETRLQTLLLAGVKPAGPTHQLMISTNVRLDLTLIPAGSFVMGSPADELERDSDEGPQHRVTLTKAFCLGVYQVTQSQWQMLMGNNPSHFQGADRPVEKVSWEACQKFCKKLTAKTGRKFRLPSEAEWEYACRAGTTSAFAFGATISTEHANYMGAADDSGKESGYRQQTIPVGGGFPNAWGLYDMHGNVEEWCLDSQRTYEALDLLDPLYTKPGTRVVRGGSWPDHPKKCRSAYRIGRGSDFRRWDLGCRVLMDLD